jgi:hypothetical protein
MMDRRRLKLAACAVAIVVGFNVAPVVRGSFPKHLVVIIFMEVFWTIGACIAVCLIRDRFRN